MMEEIALFIDFENIRYSFLNTKHREPNPQDLINIARRFGTVMVAKAYADWSRQPESFKGSLTAGMIDRVDCPVKTRDRFRPAWTGSPSMPSPRESNYDMWSASSTTIPIVPQEDEHSAASENTNGQNGKEGTYQSVVQSTVDLNMLMDIIETVFDRPSISTYVLMTGDRDFTRICARLKLRLNKTVIIAGVPGTVSRDLISASNQYIILGSSTDSLFNHTAPQQNSQMIETTDTLFLQFLDYIDRHWAWRTVIGIANFISDPYNHKNRFRGRLNRTTARDLLQTCITQGILAQSFDSNGNEDLRLNRTHPSVETALAAPTLVGQGSMENIVTGPFSQMGPWNSNQSFASSTIIESSEIIAIHGQDDLMDDSEETNTPVTVLSEDQNDHR